MPETKKIKSKALSREFTFDRAAVDAEARTLPISFSSEYPVERWFGIEILDHDPASVDLGRLNDGAPLLLGHQWDDQIGVVESASLTAEKVGRAVIRFGKSARAEEIFQDVVDGIRTKISVGYRIDEMVLEKREEENDTYRVTRWTPLEVSIVPIPADPSIGVGRELDTEHEITLRGLPAEEPTIRKEETTMPEPTINVEEVRAEARKAEQLRIREINALGDKCGCATEARQFIDSGKTVEEFRTMIVNEKWAAAGQIREVAEGPELGLSEREQKGYSFLRALNAAASGDWKDAGFELECSRATALKMRKDPQGFFIPHDVLMGGQRDYVSIGLTSHTGEKTVATDLLSGSFIEMLRNSMMVKQMGMRTLSGLVGDIAIPRQTGGATAYWLTEDSAATDSIQAFDQIGMTPKTVAGQTQVTRKLLQQSSLDVESLIRQDLATTLALAIDFTALHSDGTGNRPKGITGTSGIATVALGANGLAPTYAHVVQMETEVAVDNALFGSVGYLTNAKVRGKLKTTFINSTGGETPIWGKGEGNGWGEMNGYKAGVSNQVLSNLVKGTSDATCSALFFGNWADLIMGLWGGLDVIVDPYTGSSSGRVKVVMFQDLDLVIRHPESFSVILDALTV